MQVRHRSLTATARTLVQREQVRTEKLRSVRQHICQQLVRRRALLRDDLSGVRDWVERDVQRWRGRRAEQRRRQALWLLRGQPANLVDTALMLVY